MTILAIITGQDPNGKEIHLHSKPHHMTECPAKKPPERLQWLQQQEFNLCLSKWSSPVVHSVHMHSSCAVQWKVTGGSYGNSILSHSINLLRQTAVWRCESSPLFQELTPSPFSGWITNIPWHGCLPKKILLNSVTTKASWWQMATIRSGDDTWLV